MPLLHARPEPNDGGYAVADYGAGRARARHDGRPARARRATCARAGMALCIDVVLNHTAREHAWAQAALAGDAGQARPLPHVPRPRGARRLRADAARGLPRHRARQLHLGARARPLGVDDVQRLPVGPRLHEPRGLPRDGRGRCSASPPPGVDVLRLDAVPFLWKRMGTNCQNQPEVHQLLQALRAVMRIAAPAVAFKAEAIVSPAATSSRYLGTGRHEGKECDLAYHNVLMVLLWSSLASRTRRADDAARCAAMPPVPPGAGWVTYVRCHDDIGWAITEEDAARGRRGRLPAPALPRRLLRRRLPRHVRPRRALPGRRRDGRGAHERARRPRSPGSRRRWSAATRSRSSSRSGACCCSTRSPSPTAGCR